MLALKTNLMGSSLWNPRASWNIVDRPKSVVIGGQQSDLFERKTSTILFRIVDRIENHPAQKCFPK